MPAIADLLCADKRAEGFGGVFAGEGNDGQGSGAADGAGGDGEGEDQ